MSSRKEHWSRSPSTEMGRRNLKASMKAVPQKLNIDFFLFFFFLANAGIQAFGGLLTLPMERKKRNKTTNTFFFPPLLGGHTWSSSRVPLLLFKSWQFTCYQGHSCFIAQKFLSMAASLYARVLGFLLRLLAGCWRWLLLDNCSQKESCE